MDLASKINDFYKLIEKIKSELESELLLKLEKKEALELELSEGYKKGGEIRGASKQLLKSLSNNGEISDEVLLKLKENKLLLDTHLLDFKEEDLKNHVLLLGEEISKLEESLRLVSR